MTRLILVRHGQTDWNKDGRIQGQLDIPLNAEGKSQTKTLIAGLANLKGIKSIDALYSSELLRSYETASEIGKVFNLKVNKVAELNELNQGVWQGLLEKQIQSRYKKIYSIWKATPLATTPPKGEGLKEASDRIIPAVQKILRKHKNQTVCIVSHEIVSAIIKCHYKNIDLNEIWHNIPKNASMEVLSIRNG